MSLNSESSEIHLENEMKRLADRMKMLSDRLKIEQRLLEDAKNEVPSCREAEGDFHLPQCPLSGIQEIDPNCVLHGHLYPVCNETEEKEEDEEEVAQEESFADKQRAKLRSRYTETDVTDNSLEKPNEEVHLSDSWINLISEPDVSDIARNMPDIGYKTPFSEERPPCAEISHLYIQNTDSEPEEIMPDTSHFIENCARDWSALNNISNLDFSPINFTHIKTKNNK